MNKNISKAAKAVWQKPGYREYMSAIRSKPCSEEKKAKIRASVKKSWKNPKVRISHLKGCQTRWRRSAPKDERLIQAQLRKHHIRYRTQAILATRYVVDILLVEHPIVIECDDAQNHRWGKDAKGDRKRDRCLEKLGFTVIRIPREETLVSPTLAFQKYLGGLL